jgi:alkyl hydroperoxide reductase subunit F
MTLDAGLVAQLRSHFDKIVQPIRLVASLDATPKSVELRDLLTEIAGLAPDRIQVSTDGDDARRPSFAIERTGTAERQASVRFAGIPLGHEFTSLVLALLQVGGHEPNVKPDARARVEGLDGEHHFETYFSLSCQNCPDVVQALNAISVLNPNVTHTAIDGALFRREADERAVMAVPAVFLNGEPFAQGRMSLDEIVDRLTAAPAPLDDREPYDVLVVGAGPAGATAAIYAARKGIRTGIVAERLGGQVLDTMSIENFVSVPHTEGPRFARALEEHVRDHDVDVIDRRRVVTLEPADDVGGMATVELDSGAHLHARTVVITTGARWRDLGVPGEHEYRNRGVTYCPHCDGPLFANKRVAVVGGGNSGVEAAIDLAGITAHVTLLEFDDRLRADDVLQRKLRSLPNVDVIVGARTTEVAGDGTRVTGLTYEDRATRATRTVEVDGVFVQIGLLPNAEWLDGTVELSPRGEIVVDDAARTSVPGVFAAGDCTTVPYKQIVVAMGQGATASLSAFDHLIRT